jgi:L-asparagine oxygenase
MNIQMCVDTKQTLVKNGWCLFRDAELSVDILRAAALFGRPVCQQGSSPVSIIMPHETLSARRNTTSALYGLGAFPLHTDMAHWPLPPRYIVMRARNSTQNIPTLLIDSTEIKLDQSSLSSWRRAVWRVSKVRHPFLCSMYFEHHRRLGIRWDFCTMSPYGTLATEIVDRVYREFENLSNTQAIAITWESTDDILVIDNWRMLHSRPAIPKSAIERILERVLVEESCYE